MVSESMASRFEFDETRDAIGAGELTDQERRDMLNKFKDAGGKVLSEKELKRQQEEQAKAAGSGAGRGGKGGAGGGPINEIKTPSQIAREKARMENERKMRIRQENEKAMEKLTGGKASFFIRLRCFMQGLTPFSVPEVKPKFLNFLALNVKEALVGFNIVGNELFLKDRNLSQKIQKSLDAKNPLLMEILEYSHTMYKQNDFDKIIEAVHANPGRNVPLSALADPLKNFYRNLYYLYPYQETLKRTLQMAVDVYRMESKNEADINRLEGFKKKALRDVRNVFQVAFPKIFQLICRNDLTDYPPFSPLLEKVIGVEQSEKLGKRKKGEATKFAGSTTEEEQTAAAEEVAESNLGTEDNVGNDEKKEEEAKAENAANPILATREYQYGMSLMKFYNLRDLRKKVDPRNYFGKIPYNDKVLLAYLFFMEYDQEYSFVQTTTKIKLNPDYQSGSKTDYRQILADLYNESRDVIRAFEKYAEALKELDSLKKKKQSSNYIEQSKLETKQEKNVDVEARNTRGLIRKYMTEIARHLARLIADMKAEKVIVGNMDDPITFDSNLEGKKRLNGKPVKQCIMEAYCYTIALKERLENGDLFGGIIEMSDEEMTASFGATFRDPAAGAPEGP